MRRLIAGSTREACRNCHYNDPPERYHRQCRNAQLGGRYDGKGYGRNPEQSCEQITGSDIETGSAAEETERIAEKLTSVIPYGYLLVRYALGDPFGIDYDIALRIRSYLLYVEVRLAYVEPQMVGEAPVGEKESLALTAVMTADTVRATRYGAREHHQRLVHVDGALQLIEETAGTSYAVVTAYQRMIRSESVGHHGQPLGADGSSLRRGDYYIVVYGGLHPHCKGQFVGVMELMVGGDDRYIETVVASRQLLEHLGSMIAFGGIAYHHHLIWSFVFLFQQQGQPVLDIVEVVIDHHYDRHGLRLDIA